MLNEIRTEQQKNTLTKLETELQKTINEVPYIFPLWVLLFI